MLNKMAIYFDWICSVKIWMWEGIGLIIMAPGLSISDQMSPFGSFYDSSFSAKCAGLRNSTSPKQILHCAHITLHVGSAIALAMMYGSKKMKVLFARILIRNSSYVLLLLCRLNLFVERRDLSVKEEPDFPVLFENYQVLNK